MKRVYKKYGVWILPTVVVSSLIMLISGKRKQVKPREYQIEIDMDSIHIFDGNRRVGAVPWDDGKVDSVILYDNQ